jgi:hypothetical protein
MTRRFPRIAAAFALLASVALPALALAGVQLAVTPATLSVAVGDTFTVNVDVTAAGSAFNGVDLAVAFDPAALAYLPGTQADQEGALMTAPCGNTFYLFTHAADSLHFADTILCNGGSATGPGRMLSVRFTATTPGSTPITIRRVRVYSDGFYVNPVTTADAQVTVGGTLSAPPPGADARIRWLASPNPARGPCRLRVEGVRETSLPVRIVDATGRLVRRLETDANGELAWNGRDAAGRVTPPGIYLAIVRAGTRELKARIVRLP